MQDNKKNITVYDKNDVLSTLNSIVQQIKELDKAKEDYLKILKDFLGEEEKNNELKIINFEGKPVSRNYKIYPEIIEKLEIVRNKYTSYTMQNIINTLLKEILDKYLSNN